MEIIKITFEEYIYLLPCRNFCNDEPIAMSQEAFGNAVFELVKIVQTRLEL